MVRAVGFGVLLCLSDWLISLELDITLRSTIPFVEVTTTNSNSSASDPQQSVLLQHHEVVSEQVFKYVLFRHLQQ